MLYMALGDDKEWQRFSRPKPIRWDATAINGNIVFKIPDMDWMATKSCTITHWWIISERDEPIRNVRFKHSFSVRRGDTVTVTDCSIECVGPLDPNFEDDTPYLV